MPLVSILITNYNYGEFLGEAIESGLTQTHPEIEVIVVDDGSTDDSRSVIESFGRRIRAIHQRRAGQAGAFNSGFAASRGSIVCFLDADDRFVRHKAAETARIFSEHPSVGWIFHRLRPIDAEGRPLPQKRRDRPSSVCDFGPALRSRYSVRFSTPASSGLCFTRRLLGQILPMPQAHGVLMSDRYVKYAAMALSPGYYCREQLADQRRHDRNLYVGNVDHEKTKFSIRILSSLALRQRFPQIRRFTNYSFAEALSVRGRHDRMGEEIERSIADYLNETTPLESLEIKGLVLFHRARRWFKGSRAPVPTT